MTTKPMKFTGLLFLLTFTGLVAGTSTAFSENLSALLTGEMQNFAPYDAPRPFKDFTFLNAEGEEERVSDYRGKVILVNFWATWCAPCRKEMPSLDRLQEALGGVEFVVLAIGQDLQGMEKVTTFFEKLNIKNLAPLNDKTVKSGRSAGVFGLPASILLNAKGEEVGRLVGPAEWDAPEAKALINHVIRGS
ncbi:TlpA disulfide reductase family protein [uncultured Sneathiella sp.]|uniref:TlpA family protein disulfide reductase n=1 Tax=uncultured Sneathiella sp. TaxID=879315 RepID=UPI0025966F68|nr:TlpA disulfide reductase family protein [uncultured Sneathiella sp.]